MALKAAPETLRKYGWLSLTDLAFQDTVLAKCDHHIFSAGEPIYRAGDETGGVVGVVEGQVGLHLEGRSNDQTFGLLAGPGFWSGDLAAITGRRRRVGIYARSPCRVLRLPRAEMLRMAEARPEAWRYFALLAAMNLAVAIDLVDILRREKPAERVLLHIRLCLESSPAGGGSIQVSQNELASLAGLSRTTVNAVLAMLERDGVITKGYGKITRGPKFEDAEAAVLFL